MKQFQSFTLACLFAATVCYTSLSYAAHTAMVNAKTTILNLDDALKKAKATLHYNKSFSESPLPTNTFVAFPIDVPKANSKLYASFEQTPTIATITIDSTADCKGVKFCNIGLLTFQAMENPTIYYDRDNKLATTQVHLNNNSEGFYTRGFAMADFKPANIQWRDREILYTLTWTIGDKDSLVRMANSVISQLH